MVSKLLEGFKAFLSGGKKTEKGLSVNPLTLTSPRFDIGPPDLAGYRRMRFDGQVSAGLAVIKLPVLAREYNIEAVSEDVKTFLENNLKVIYRDLLRKSLTAVEFGFAPLELVWELGDDGHARVTRIKDPLPDGITVLTDDTGEFHGLAQKPDRKVEYPRCFLFTHRREHGNHYGVSRLRPAHPYWRTKQIVYLFLNRYLERKGNPPVVVTYPPDVISGGGSTPDKNGRAALELGKKLLENSSVALPYVNTGHGDSAWGIGYLEDNPRSDMFLRYVEHLDRMILRSMFVPEHILSNDAQQGSYSLSRVHADMFLLSQDGLIADIENTFNEQLIRPLVEVNFGAGTDARLTIARLSESDRQLAEDVFMEMVKRGDARPMVEPLARQLGLVVSEETPVESQ